MADEMQLNANALIALQEHIRANKAEAELALREGEIRALKARNETLEIRLRRAVIGAHGRIAEGIRGMLRNAVVTARNERLAHRLEGEIRALREWQPIETAPNKAVLVYAVDCVDVGCFLIGMASKSAQFGWRWFTSTGNPSISPLHNPTHWKHLPEHPSGHLQGPPQKDDK